MKKFLKFFFGVLVLSGAIYVIYLGYNEWYLSGKISKAADTAKEKGSEVLTQAKNSIFSDAESIIKKNAADLAKWLGDKAYSLENAVSGSSSSVPASSLVSSASFVSNQVISITSSTAGSFSVPPPTVSFLTHVSEPVYISLVSDGAYEIKWGDGLSEDGTGSGLNKITVASHSWSKAGDYVINITASVSGSENSYSFPIRVLE